MNSIEIAKQKLQETDWAVLSDVTDLQNKEEFIVYRQQLRFIVINNLDTSNIPTTPIAVWSTSSSE